MNIKEVSKQIYKNAVEHGFYDKSNSLTEHASNYGVSAENYVKSLIISQRLALIHSEVSEALEADRKQIWANKEKFILQQQDGNFEFAFRDSIKNTFEDECADVAIRLFDMCEWLGIDLEWHIEQKMKYNQMREKMHGKQY